MKCVVMYNDNQKAVVEDGVELDALLKKIEDDNDKVRRKFWCTKMERQNHEILNIV